MLSDTLDKVALECGAVRDPNGYYIFTPEELKTFVEKINETKNRRTNEANAYTVKNQQSRNNKRLLFNTAWTVKKSNFHLISLQSTMQWIVETLNVECVAIHAKHKKIN